MKQIDNPRYDEALQNEVEAMVDHFINTHQSGAVRSCSALVLDILDGDAHLADDEAQYMKDRFLDLMVLMTDPEISAKLARKGKPDLITEFGSFLKRLILFFDYVKNPLALAEMIKVQLHEGLVVKSRLEIWYEYFAATYQPVNLNSPFKTQIAC